jgi:BirA family biotin operon repressor/biotin-[acetyl-CoA-carboxylase] ligase
MAPPDSGLTLSVVLAGPEWFALAPRIPLAAGVACADLLRTRYDLPVGLKWPNDLVVGSRKCGGILCEGVTTASRFAGVVIGIGMNINADEAALGEELAGRATSIFLETGRTEADLDGLASDVRDAIVAAAEGLSLEPPDRLLARWAALDSIRGRQVWFGEGDGATSGIADGIAPDGGLLVQTADGLRTLHAGEVTTQPPSDPR